MTMLPSEGGRPVTKSRDMWDHGRWHWQGLTETCRALVGRLVLLADGTSSHNRPFVVSMEDHQNRARACLCCTPGGWARWEKCPCWRTWERRWDKEVVIWTVTWCRIIRVRLFDLILYVPDQSSIHTGSKKNLHLTLQGSPAGEPGHCGCSVTVDVFHRS